MSKHSAGPWRYEVRREHLGGTTNLSVIAESGEILADRSFYTHNFFRHAVVTDDFRLMAAAPDLLNAVKLVLALHDHPEGGPGGTPPGFCVKLDPKAHEQLTRAIKKAEEG